jgi:hypothetical protein
MDYTPIVRNQHLTDTQRVSEWAAIALNEGRTELGCALARLAVQALRVDAARNAAVTASVPVPVPAVDEPPLLRAVPAWQDTPDQGAHHHHHGEPVDDPAAEAAALHAYTGAVPAADIPTPRRCATEIAVDGVSGPCGGGAFWSPDHNRWRHVDVTLDAAHRVQVMM